MDPSPTPKGLQHVPVLDMTVLETLRPTSGNSVLDCTLGLGGHAALFLKKTAPDGRLTGLDADARHLAIARDRLAPFTDRIHLFQANFGDLAALDLGPVDILFADLGLCSAHVDDPARGFSFRFDAPLDLRFDADSGITAAEWIADHDADALTRVLRDYAELRFAPRIARAIHAAQPATTTQLRAAVESVAGYRTPRLLPQIFQALRIVVNDELAALEHLLTVGPTLLSPGGRMGVIAYHSLEDRPVKHTFRALTTPERDPITGAVSVPAPFALLTSRALQPSDEEIARNPRARSARFRALQRL